MLHPLFKFSGRRARGFSSHGRGPRGRGGRASGQAL
jgi:hypothetical protein